MLITQYIRATEPTKMISLPIVLFNIYIHNYTILEIFVILIVGMVLLNQFLPYF